MRRIFAGTLLVLLASISPTGPAGRVQALASRVQALALSRDLSVPPVAPASSPNLLYIAAGHLWLRPVDGGPARTIPTPWPMSAKGSSTGSFQWSPDGQRIALDDMGGRLAVIRLGTGRITVLFRRLCGKNCSSSTYAWSPNGHYLAIVQPVGTGEQAILWVWDSAVGRMHRVLAGVAGYVAFPAWSHDSTRIAIPVGKFDTAKDIFPQAVAVDLAGHVIRLSKGTSLSWSPDDRFVGIIRPNTCGANTCDEDVVVQSSTGGGALLLAKHSSSLFDNPIWAPLTHGYTFDRWLLDGSGRPVRRLAGPHERLLSWKPDGTLLALQTYYPYQSARDVLYLSTPAGRRVRFSTDTHTSADCGACSKDVYGITWGRGNLFAYSTRTYPTPKNVVIHSHYFVSSTAGGPVSRIGIAHPDNVTILGFVNADAELIVQDGRTVSRYSVATHRRATIVTGLAAGFNTTALDPTATVPRPPS